MTVKTDGKLLSSYYCPVFLTTHKLSYFMLGAGPLFMTRKVSIYSDKISFSRSLFGPGFVLRKQYIDTIESVPAGIATHGLRFTHHDKTALSPITVQPSAEFLEALRDDDYPI